ncbi:MAG: metallophosphoesterase [Candidatus Nanohaloarchaea archaeon]|nr:metallophosphoesterase [Candidatus Nanohaloarchaea archaeon]
MPDDEIPDGLVDDLKSGMTYDDFSEEYDWSRDKARSVVEELRATGRDISEKTVDQYGTKMYQIEDEVDDTWRWVNEDGHYNFAVISDTHLGSTGEQLDSLNDFYDRLEDEDIDVVFHAGDISDGTVKNNGRGVYRGHSNHLQPEAIGWDRLKNYVVENYPERDGIDTLFIEGNHDHQLFKNTGIRFGEQLDAERDDLHFLGDSYANIDLGEVDMDLVHPSGGAPYTLGYRAQTWLRDKPDEQKADITVFGHLHQFLNAETEGSQVLYAGAWQGPTPFLERKGIKPKAGGWIVDMEVEDGDIRSWQTNRVMYPIEGESDLSSDDISKMLEGDGERA